MHSDLVYGQYRTVYSLHNGIYEFKSTLFDCLNDNFQAKICTDDELFVTANFASVMLGFVDDMAIQLTMVEGVEYSM